MRKKLMTAAMVIVALAMILVFGGCGEPASSSSSSSSSSKPNIYIDLNTDTDMDGVPDDLDCGPNNREVYPGAPERCDGVDNQCPGDAGYGEIDEGCDVDADNDGAPAPNDCDDSDPNNWDSCSMCGDLDSDNWFTGCDAYVTLDGPDCDDTRSAVYPGAPEICDGRDNQCPGDAGYGPVDEGCVVTVDTDGDGSSDALDCNDFNATIYPGAPELCDGVDNQCPGDVGYGTVDEGCWPANWPDPDPATAYPVHLIVADQNDPDYELGPTDPDYDPVNLKFNKVNRIGGGGTRLHEFGGVLVSTAFQFEYPLEADGTKLIEMPFNYNEMQWVFYRLMRGTRAEAELNPALWSDAAFWVNQWALEELANPRKAYLNTILWWHVNCPSGAYFPINLDEAPTVTEWDTWCNSPQSKSIQPLREGCWYGDFDDVVFCPEDCVELENGATWCETPM